MISARRRMASITERSQGAPLPTIQLEDVESGSGKLLHQLPMEEPGQARFRTGDILFGKLRPYLSKSFMVDRDLQGSSEFLCLRPSRLLTRRFLLYLTLSRQWLDHAQTTAYGAKMPRTSWEQMADCPIPDLPLHEQIRIADFLDDRVARIDQIVLAREAQSRACREVPWATFARGLAGLRSRPSPLRRYLSFLADGPFGSAFTSSDYVDEGPAVIRLGNIGFAHFRGDDLARVPDDIYRRFPRCWVHPGDLLIASLGDAGNHAGRACLAPKDLGTAMVKGKCFVARPEPTASADFLAVLLSSSVGEEALAVQGNGATRNMLNFDRLLATEFPMPSLADQVRLEKGFRSMAEDWAVRQAALDRSTDLLAEYRQSLITAAVTGELDVTTASTKIPGV